MTGYVIQHFNDTSINQAEEHTHVGGLTADDVLLHEVATFDVQILPSCLRPQLAGGDNLIEWEPHELLLDRGKNITVVINNVLCIAYPNVYLYLLFSMVCKPLSPSVVNYIVRIRIQVVNLETVVQKGHSSLVNGHQTLTRSSRVWAALKNQQVFMKKKNTHRLDECVSTSHHDVKKSGSIHWKSWSHIW